MNLIKFKILCFSVVSANAFASFSMLDALKQTCSAWEKVYGSSEISYSYRDAYGRAQQGKLVTQADFCVTDLNKVSFRVRRINAGIATSFNVNLKENPVDWTWSFHSVHSDCVELTIPYLTKSYAAQFVLTAQFREDISKSVIGSICPAQEAAVKSAILRALSL